MERAGSDVVVSDDPETVAGARRLMVPGQGAAGPTMATLRRSGLEKAIREAMSQGAYLLGVCVGLQLLFDSSAEDDTSCLGLLPGRVERLEGTARLPHMGWNDVEPVGTPTRSPTACPPARTSPTASPSAMPAPPLVAETEVDGVPVRLASSRPGRGGRRAGPPRALVRAGLQMLRGFLRWSDAA